MDQTYEYIHAANQCYEKTGDKSEMSRLFYVDKVQFLNGKLIVDVSAAFMLEKIVVAIFRDTSFEKL